MLVTARDGRADEARLGRRRPRRRVRRQRRGLGGRRGGADRQRPGLGRRATCPAQMPGPASQALRPEHRQPGHADDRHGDDGDGAFAPDFDDEIVAGSCVTHDGAIRHEPTRDAPWKETHRMNEPIVWLTIFVLSVFVGIEVISKVSSTLHTPLMSGRQRHPRDHPARRDPGHRHAPTTPSRSSSGWSRSCWPRSTWSAASWSPTGCCRCSCARSRPPTSRREEAA